MGKRCQILSVLCLLLATGGYARAEHGQDQTEKNFWAVLAGYGVTHRNIGNTRAHVETADFVLRYGRHLTDEIGRSWYRCQHSILVELPIHLVVDPDTSPMVGVNVLGNLTFTASEGLQPYFLGGGGFVYTDADIPGLGSKYNGNYQAGAGVLYRLQPPYYLNVEYRMHHISNAGSAEPNDPLNASKFLVGITGRF